MDKELEKSNKKLCANSLFSGTDTAVGWGTKTVTEAQNYFLHSGRVPLLLFRIMYTVLVQIILKAAAFIALALGLIGAFLPVLPTTPFLILAAALSYKSSPRLRKWLLNHPVFGKTIRDFLQTRTISMRTLYKALTMLWLGLLISTLLVQNMWLSIALVVTGVLVTLYLLQLNVDTE